MEAVGDDSVKALMDQVATMGLTKRTTEGLDMALLRELVSYQGSNPMSDMEGVVASMREGSLNSFLIFELSALVTDFPMTALKGALMGAPYKHKVKEGAYFGMSFLVSQLKNDKTYAKYRSYHVSNNTIRMTSLTSHLLLSLSDRSPTSSALDVIYNIEKVFPGIEKMKADEETAILSWSSEAVMKKDSVTNASKAAKEAQQRAKNSKRFPMLVPKELYKTLVDVTGHEGFIPFEGISAKDFLEAIMQCATELFNGKTESFLELKKLLSNMKIVGVDSDEVQTDVAKQLQSLIFMGEKVTEMSGEEILLQPDGTEDVEELQQMLVENASALSAVFSKMDGDQIKSLGFPDQVTTKLIENYKRKMPVTAAEVLSISFELGTLGMKPKTDAQRVQELVDVLGGLTVEGIIKKKFASLTKKVSTLDEFKTVLKAGDVYGIMDKTDKATKVTEILAEAKLDRSFFDAALLCVACRELDYKDEAMKLVAKSDPGFIGELIEVAAGTTMTKDLDEFKDLFKKEIKDIWLAGILPLWVDAAKLAYDFLISVLEFGDVLEQSAMSHWKLMCVQQQKGWYHDMIQFFRGVSILNELGGMDVVLTWGAQEAKHWKQHIFDRCYAKAVGELQHSLSHGKYSFLLDIIPTFDSPRAFGVTFGDAAGRSLFRWLLSSHCLEIEIGRYERKPQHERICKRCYRLVFINALGNERHALTDCARGERERQVFTRALAELLGEINEVCIFDAVNRLPSLTRIQQKFFWKNLARLTLIISNEIVQERRTAEQTPNMWLNLTRSAQCRSLLDAAHRYFRTRLRRQIRRTAILVPSSESDDVVFVSHNASS